MTLRVFFSWFTLKPSIMDLRFSSLLLAVCLFLGSSALTPEECEPLIKPKQITGASEFHGRMHTIMGYTDHKVLKAILKIMQNSWMDLTQGPAGPNYLAMIQRNRMNGTCISSKANVSISIEGNVAHMEMGNMTTKSHSLPACEGCMVSSINYTFTDLQGTLQKMRMGSFVEEDILEITQARAIYLMSNKPTVEESCTEQFKKQAGCLGFTGEPDFHYNSEHELCAENEGDEVEWQK
ncbi:uncharacterized protein LOC121523257 [Cheilinus undulatus]|uniref:uncharacterized protein LOC121523257 n=1 Tax=Cheilinus undulatus TaxID=241271 RepID=UPI001BD63A4D|nr:uncharacterized protein LOC121523257 [Cheilinus undulatus]